MREIKFRAWDNDNEVFSFFGFSDIRRFIEKMDSFEDYFSYAYFKELDEKTGNPLLMQFTGLKDKNGVDIYEGDICKISDPYENSEKVFVVEYKNGGFIVEWNSMFCGGEADITTIGWAIDSEFFIEIIGNIYQNPELVTTPTRG